MNHRAVIFPDTVPSERMLIPLVQVFEELVYFQPVENDTVVPELNTPVIDALIAEGCCRVFAPSPLGEDREKFRQLVEDIRNRREDYGVQFAQASLASIPSFTRPVKETKSSLVSELLGAKGISEKEKDRNAGLLWQARLVLKLGEIFDADQESLRRNLQAVRNREENLLAELRKEKETLFSLTGNLGAASPVTPEMVEMRLRAWTRLSVQDKAAWQATPVFLLTGSGDGFEMLADTFEHISGRAPIQTGSLSLPARCPDTETMIRQSRLFREETKELRAEFFLGLERCREETAGPEDAAWESALEALFPAQMYGRSRVRFCCCPGISAEELLRAAFLGDPAPVSLRQSEGVGVCIGRLEEVSGPTG